MVPGLIATVIFAIPAPIRLTHLGITTVPKQLIEAGEAFGATKRQLLWKVELPAALPTIMAGLTQCIMLSLSMVVIAALVGADGLGKPVVRALNTVNIPMGFEAGLAIVVLAIMLDRVCRVEPAQGEMPDDRGRLLSRTSTSSSASGRARRSPLLDARRDPRRDPREDRRGARRGRRDARLSSEGEICVLMGLSGSGKSTLLRAVNGLNQPVARARCWCAAGDRTVDVAHCPPRSCAQLAMHGVAMVFQQFALLPWRTVAENVGFGLELRGVAAAERRAARGTRSSSWSGSTQWADKYAHELSGGMQQRVGLARAFATDAPILLMDEPFSALDPLIRTKLQDELLELQQQAAQAPSSSSATISTRR